MARTGKLGDRVYGLDGLKDVILGRVGRIDLNEERFRLIVEHVGQTVHHIRLRLQLSFAWAQVLTGG